MKIAKKKMNIVAQLTALKEWSQNPEAYYKKLKAFVESEDPVPRSVDKSAKEKKKIVKVEKPQKPKPKPDKPKPFEIDYDWRLAPWQDYPEDDDIKKLVSQPSLEESNATYWENEYYDYKKNGGDLPFLEFKRMMINEADIDMTKKIDKIMKDKMRGEGLAALLGVRA